MNVCVTEYENVFASSLDFCLVDRARHTAYRLALSARREAVMALRRILAACRIDHTNNTVDIEADELYRLLSHRRRRVAISLLEERGEEIVQDELARSVAAIESGAAPLEVNEKKYESVYVALYQSHLPKLDEFDVVEWDRECGHVAPGKELSNIAAIVDAIDRRTPDDDCE